ncbi:ThiF family adenylyltransferase [Ensifer sp. IC3342]|nr:ThiF family adenylyltransferase [Ensifer sp. BRP08]MCA1450405.1 ThiF family adenylyltransferase [Ensifer sp. IC3342]
MTWWLVDRHRARAEKAAFAALQEEHDWLKGVRFKYLEDLQLCVDVEVTHGGEKFPLAVRYPATFPDTPPMVVPYGEQRLSAHQYGAGGELCLQWRPDNWDSSVTGAMMVESAHALIEGERPIDDAPATVPSAHKPSLGAELRFESWRLMVPQGAWSSLDGKLPELMVEISLLETARQMNRVTHLRTIGAEGNEFWKSHQPAPANAANRTGYLLRTEQDMSHLALYPGGVVEDLAKSVPELAATLVKPDWTFLILVEANGRKTAFDILRNKDGMPLLIPYRIIEEGELVRRSASNREAIGKSRVAIVGCGSIGSKVAASLARAGLRKFVLVDDDIFLTGNLVRNELDARAIGWHKAEALRDRIEHMVSDADVVTRRVALGSQDAAATMESTLEVIGECDLIVEATANATSFNLSAGAAKRHRKPMVWAEIFGGGVGGIVARARPDVDPVPLAARNEIVSWCEDRGVPWDGGEGDSYDLDRNCGPPFIADDADVSVIAAHTARFVIDILQGGETAFPYSAYAIGMAKEWIFAAPFDTWPIAFRPADPWDPQVEDAAGEDIFPFFAEMFNEEHP